MSEHFMGFNSPFVLVKWLPTESICGLDRYIKRIYHNRSLEASELVGRMMTYHKLTREARRYAIPQVCM